MFVYRARMPYKLFRPPDLLVFSQEPLRLLREFPINRSDFTRPRACGISSPARVCASATASVFPEGAREKDARISRPVLQ